MGKWGVGKDLLFVYIKQMTGKELKQIFLDLVFLPDFNKKEKKYCIQRREWGGRRRSSFSLYSAGTRSSDDFRSYCEAGPGAGGEWGVRRAARGAVGRLSVIGANDGGRALRGTMRGAAGFVGRRCLCGVCLGAARGSGVGRKEAARKGSLSAHWPGRRRARPSAARPPRAAGCEQEGHGGRPLEACWEMAAGAAGAPVPRRGGLQRGGGARTLLPEAHSRPAIPGKV